MNMKVSKMIEILQSFPPDLEVMVTDGFNLQFYAGDYEIQLFEELDGTKIVDIGVGGCRVE
jgi:hypothetical protein